jgi:hypothetical protein
MCDETSSGLRPPSLFPFETHLGLVLHFSGLHGSFLPGLPWSLLDYLLTSKQKSVHHLLKNFNSFNRLTSYLSLMTIQDLPERIAFLILLFLHHELSGYQRIELDEWILESEEHELLFDDLISRP